MVQTGFIITSAMEVFSATSGTNAVCHPNGTLTFARVSDTVPAVVPTIGPMVRGQMRKWVLQKSLTEQVQIGTITFVAANNTTYSFQVQQFPNGGIPVMTDVEYTSGSSATAAQIAAAIVGTINASQAGGGVQVIATGASTVITLTAQAGYPLFTVTQPQSGGNVVYASAMPTIAPHATPGTALAGTTTITVTTLAAQTFKTGDTVNITTATGFTFTNNATGVATVASVTARIIYASATTFTLDGYTGSGTNTGTIVITQVAQTSYGSAAQVAAQFNPVNGVPIYVPNSSYWYSSITITTYSPSQIDGTVQEFKNVLWYMSSLVASPYTVASNVATFVADFQAFLNGVAAGNITATNIFGIPNY